IRINSRSIERIIWIIVVILLIVGISYMYFSGFGCDAVPKEKVVDKEPAVVEPEETIDDTEPVVEAPDEETEPEPEAEEEPPAEETGDSTVSTLPEGQLTFTVDDPIKIKNTMLLRKDSQYEVRGEDYAKLTAIYFKIDNNKKSFIPKIEVYVYDTDDNKEDYKEILTFTTMIGKGEVFEKVERVNIGFNDINSSKTFEVYLRDELGTQLGKYKKIMTLN
ncbi:hypothetical protein KY335_02950, partial [Candidatus Woesearchaeota archaeon]|nr:hypothetical protein [Candidatus Woesearchaeota archaeon]